jgi:hypothetical protein
VDETEQDAQERRFAGAVGADESCDAGGDLNFEVLEGNNLAKIMGEAGDLDY